MCPFVEKKKKSVVFSLPPTLFFQLRPTPPPPRPPIVNNYHNVQTPLLFQTFLLFGTRKYSIPNSRPETHVTSLCN